MLRKLLFQILAATAGLWLAVTFVPGVEVKLLSDSNFFGIRLDGLWQVYLFLGLTLGLLNFFLKPILNLITLPLRIITLGIFGLIINIAFVWALDVMFGEFTAPFIYPILITTLIIWALNLVLSVVFKDKD